MLLCAAVRLLTCITAVVRVADFTNKGAGLSLAALGVTAILRMFGVVFALLFCLILHRIFARWERSAS